MRIASLRLRVWRNVPQVSTARWLHHLQPPSGCHGHLGLLAQDPRHISVSCQQGWPHAWGMRTHLWQMRRDASGIPACTGKTRDTSVCCASGAGRMQRHAYAFMVNARGMPQASGLACARPKTHRHCLTVSGRAALLGSMFYLVDWTCHRSHRPSGCFLCSHLQGGG